MTTAPGPAIVVRHLTKTFRKKVAVDGISFEVPRGRFFGFLGPNGAGKSTTIKMLTGLLRPTAGEVTIEGFSLEKDLLDLKRVIGVLPEEPLNGIDPISGRVVTDLLRRLADKGVTLFFTTHVLDVVERLCDEVAIIDHGRLIAQGTLDQIRAQREVAQDASLEDVFLKLVSAEVRREDLSWIG